MMAKVDNFGCVGNKIKVAAGHYVDLGNPDPDTIDIASIAAGLSKTCRFNGQCPRFYSVAEHTIHATSLAKEAGVGGDALIAVFLHDAAEAYIGDVVKPLKNLLPEYLEIERRFEQAIGDQFDVDIKVYQPLIDQFDRAMLKAEKIAFWPDDKTEWEGFSEIETSGVKFKFWLPGFVESQFIKMAIELGLQK
jgi:hypothetical protein